MDFSNLFFVWTSAQVISFQAFFLTTTRVVRAGQLCFWFHSPYSGSSAHYQIHTRAKLLMGPFMYTAGSHNSHKCTSDHRWRSNFLWERVGAKDRNILYHHEADVTISSHVIFIQSFIYISVDTCVILCLSYNPLVHYLFCCSTCSNFGHWELSLFGPCILVTVITVFCCCCLLICIEHFLTGTGTCSRLTLYIFCPV